MLNAFHPIGDKLEYAPNCGALVADQQTLWIDLMTPTRAEEQAVEAFIGAELPTRAEMEEIEPSSRLSVVNDVLYLTAALPLPCRQQRSRHHRRHLRAHRSTSRHRPL